MSLAQYLALGKSIKQVSGPGRYKLPAGPVVPRFEGSRRGTTPGEPQACSAAVDTTEEASPLPKVGLEEIPGGEPLDGLRQPVTLTAPPPPPPPPAPAPVPAPVPEAAPVRGRWFLQLRSRDAKKQPQPRQGELALGLVQPVRNDLRDSDWDVVPVKAAPPPAPVNARPSWWARWWQWCKAPWRRANRRSR